ncbi:MAG: hypothetical protein N0C88_01425 [Candidatus Thiodiazotropha lotti]|uniref:DUF6998 domain-containing protein n=1 Tax=Candidatus Thiodiazotropha lotti TaxID=2792787 RepID=A0A9E4K0S4_9GAMM|nr:hypothetical protein [Candidatus Thiodiazotropha lotti]MCW4201972.1 hypothetical protein [Candidatus Thiodiazotropha lotti]
MDLRELSVKELLQQHSAIIDELKRRKIVRTKNNPVGDYTEWLVAKGLGLELAGNSSAGYDGIDSEGVKIQIKGRRITPENKSRQLSAIRKLEEQDFDHLVAVIFNENYEIIDAVLIPHEVIEEYATYRSHVNAHILHLKGPILNDPRIKDIKHLISS